MTDRYELINREEGSYPISSMCRWSRVSKSGYYSWRDRPQSQTAIRREELAMMIKDVFERSDGTYGYRRIQVVLERRGVRTDGSTIRAIMRDLGLQAAQPRAKVRTTVPAQDLDERPDLLRRDFTADKPGKKLCGDIPPQAGGAPSYTSGRGPGLSIWRPFWTAARKRWWVMRWPTTCTRPWCARPLTWRPGDVRSRRV